MKNIKIIISLILIIGLLALMYQNYLTLSLENRVENVFARYNVKNLILIYRIDGSLLIEYNGSDIQVRDANKFLVINATNNGDYWDVDFILNLTGKALFLKDYHTGNVKILRSVLFKYYLDKGFIHDKYGNLGMVFPLLVKGKNISISYILMPLGANPSLNSEKIFSDNLKITRETIFYLSNYTGKIVENGKIVKIVKFQKDDPILKEYSWLISKLTNISKGDTLTTIAYTSREWETSLTMNYETGIPLDIVLYAAPRTSPNSTFIINDKKVNSIPISPLGILLGIRNDHISLTLTDIQYKKINFLYFSN